MKKFFLQGFCVGAILFGSLTTFAATNYDAITATFPILVNGKVWTSDKPTVVIEGSTYLPLKALGEALDVDVNWNSELKQVEIQKKGIEQVDLTSSLSQTIEPNGILTKGSTFELGNVKFTYNGEQFEIINNSKNVVKISCSVVGVKSNGTHQWIQSPSFVGKDETKYQQDKKENGWAVYRYTNLIRPTDKLLATLNIYDPTNYTVLYTTDSNLFEDSQSPDVDGDGYYDIVFSVTYKETYDLFSNSLDNFESKVYKIEVNK